MERMVKNSLQFLFSVFSSVMLLMLVGQSATAASGITYHGKILKPDGVTPVSSATTQFRIQIRTPGGENCLLWEEQQTKDLSSTAGVFTITINDTSEPTLISNTLPFSIERVFSNRTNFTGLTNCSAGTTYNPSTVDGRTLQVFFREAPTDPWEQMPVTKVNYVPLALNSVQLEGYAANEFLKIDPLSAYTPLTAANVNTLVDIIAGTSNQYLKPATAFSGDVSGTYNATSVDKIKGISVVGAPANGQVLKYNGTNWVPAADDNSSTPADASYTVKGVVQINTDLATSGLFIAGGVLALPNVVTAGGPTGNAQTVPVITYDQKGRLTAVSTATIDDTTKLPLAGGTMTGNINMGGHDITNAANVAATNVSVRNVVLNDNDTNTVTIKTPADIAANYSLTLPVNDGAAGEVLSTDGNGVLSWVSGSSGSVLTSDYDADVLPAASCTNIQTPYWNSISGTWACQNINVAAAGGFVNGGNTFTATATLGTNSNHNLEIETNGTTKMTVTTAGNVGIGTTNPNGPLDVRGSGQYVSYIEGSGASSYAIQWIQGKSDRTVLDLEADFNKTSGSMMSISTGNANFTGTGLSMDLGTNSSGNFTGKFLEFRNSGGTGTYNGPVQFSVDSTGTVYTKGSVGIGTTNPGAALEVAGQVKITGGTPGAGKVLTSDAAGLATWVTPTGSIGGTGTTNFVPKFTAAGTIGDSRIQDNGSSISIGGAPTMGTFMELQESADTASVLDLYNASSATNASAGLSLYNNSGRVGALKGMSTGNTLGSGIYQNKLLLHSESAAGLSLLSSNSAGSITFSAGGAGASSEAMRITASQNVGIGVTNPKTTLDISGTVKMGMGPTSTQPLGIGITAGYTGAIAVTSASEYPNSGALLIDDEIIVYSQKCANCFQGTITRGAFGTTAASHTAGATVKNILLAVQADAANPRLVVVSDGSTGIGTATPATKLDVAGGIKIGTESATCAAALSGTLRYNGGSVEYCNGTSWQAFGVSGAGLTSLGGQTGNTQTFAAGSAGNSPAISSASNVHTLNVPLASAGASVTSGTISNADYVSFGAKLTSPLTTKGDILTRDATTHVRVPVGTNGQVLMADSAQSSGIKWGDAGTVTSVTSANNYVTVTNTTTTPLITANVGTAANTLAAGDDSRITGALQTSVYDADVLPAASCTTSQTPYWSTVAGTWLCQNISASASGAFIDGGNTMTATATLGTNSNHNLEIETNGTTKMTVLTTGAVGIGTTSPASQLHVSGGSPAVRIEATNAGQPSVLRFDGLDGGSVYRGSWLAFNPAAGTNQSYFGFNNGTSDVMSIRMDGNVGIGTSSPATKLDIEAASGSNDLRLQSGTVRFDILNGSAARGQFGTTITGSSIGTFSNHPFLIGTGNATRMYFDTTGKVGIGTTSPSSNLSFSGAAAQTIAMERMPFGGVTGSDFNIKAGGAESGTSNSAGGNLVLSSGISTGTASSSINFQTATPQGSGSATDNAPSTKMTILGSGNVGIGTTSPASILDINGALSQRGIAAPSLSPAGQGRIYFDSTSNTFKVSQNGGAFTDLVSAGGTVSGLTTGYIPKATSATALGNSNVQATTDGLKIITTNTAVKGVEIGTDSGGKSAFLTFTSSGTDQSQIGGYDGELQVNTVVNGPIIFKTNSSERMRILGSGNVGIGAASPSYRLELGGTASPAQSTIGINGTPALYLPVQGTSVGQLDGSLAVGNGLRSLSNTASSEGRANTSVGINSLTAATTGSYNTAFGTNSLSTLTTGSSNVGLGPDSLSSLTTGNQNVAVGRGALTSGSSGYDNVGLGVASLAALTTGSQNVAVGLMALGGGTTVSKNVAIGTMSLLQNTADNNVSLGWAAGTYAPVATLTPNTTGSNSVYIGSTSQASANGNSNEIVIGYNAIGNGSNSVTLGNTSVTKTILRSGVGIGTTAPNTALDLSGALSVRSMAAPALSPAGQGRIYFDSTSNKFRVSENAGAYADLVTSVSAGGGFVDGGNTFTGTATLGTNSNHNLEIETNGTTKMTVASGGNVGIGTTNPSYALSLGGNTARSIAMEKHSTANTAGNNLTIQAGGATLLATDKNGGTLELASGSATGNGGSDIKFYVAYGSQGAGTTTRDPSMDMVTFSGNNRSVALGQGAVATGIYSTSVGYNMTTSGSSSFGINLDTTTRTVSNSNTMAIMGGNVGIGTVTPSTKLQVAITTTGDGFSVSGNTTGGISPQFSLNDQTTQRGAMGLALASGSYSNIAAVNDIVVRAVGSGSNGNLLLTNQNATGSIKFTTGSATNNDTLKMILTNGGNFGIGVASPNTTLDIGGAFSVKAMAAPALSPAGEGRIYFDSTSNTFKVSQNGAAYTDLVGGGGASGAFVDGGNTFSGTATLGTNSNHNLEIETNGTTKMTVLAGGNVGIGTAAPGAPLEIAGTASIVNPLLKITSGAGSASDSAFIMVNSRAKLGYEGTRGSVVVSDNAFNKDIVFDSGGSERMRIMTTGNVGIGTTSPTNKLEVAGAVRATAGTISGNYSTDTDLNIDFSQANVITTTASCGSVTLNNMQDGGSYSLVVTGGTTGTCTFSHSGVTSFKFAPANGATDTASGGETVYTFLKVGAKVYVSWVTGMR